MDNPYVASADYFNSNQDRIRDHIGNISGMSNVVNLMTSEKEFAKGTIDTSNLEKLDSELATASMTAFGYGLLREEPTSVHNRKLHQIEQLRIIANNAKPITDKRLKEEFIYNAINKNSIDLTELFVFNKPITAGLLLKAFDGVLSGKTQKVTDAQTFLTNTTNNPDSSPENIKDARDKYNNAIAEMLTSISEWTKGTMTYFPFDVGKVKEEPKVEEPELKVPEDYKPIINSKGEINLVDGKRVSIEDILADIETYKTTQPPEFINYIQQFAPLFDEDGEMIAPTRDMFTAGKAGDKLFKKFNRIYMSLNPTEFIPLGPYKEEDLPKESIIKKIKEKIKKSGQIEEEELKRIKPKNKK